MVVEHSAHHLKELVIMPMEYYSYIAMVLMHNYDTAPQSLMDTIEEWCKDNLGQIGWKIDGDTVSIVEHDDIMAFKLRWS